MVLFEFRFWLKNFSEKPFGKFLNIAPHVVDTLLLASGLMLMFLSGISPFNSQWLLAKLILVMVYIVFGFIALKATGVKRTVAFILANLTIIYIIFVAIKKMFYFS
ncbi:MAG: SirB2 family protein [Proteobacteria bacterium]|nr:SirB2 family protein [Pseudomonadota bacterium]